MKKESKRENTFLQTQKPLSQFKRTLFRNRLSNVLDTLDQPVGMHLTAVH